MNDFEFGARETTQSAPEEQKLTLDTPEKPPIKGIPPAWFALFLLIVFISVGVIWSNLPAEETHPDRVLLQTTLDQLGTEMILEEIRNPFNKQQAKVYERMAQKLEQLPLKTKGVRGSAARAILILRKAAHPESPPDFSQLNEETDDVLDPELQKEAKQVRQTLNQALKELYSAKKLSKEDGQRIRKTILREAGESFPYSLALERARELSGEQELYMRKMIAIGLVFSLMLLIGLGLIVVYVLLRAHRAITPRGLPLQGAPKALGDYLALRMLFYLLVFFLVGGIVNDLPTSLRDTAWGTLISTSIALMLALFLFALPIRGVTFSLREIGLKMEDLGKKIAWGVAGWIANVPFLTCLVPLGLLLKWIPSREHPVVEQVSVTEAWLPIFLTASILAPITEEIFFRGCLFQGLSIRTRRVVLSAVISALAFGMMHPQGGTALPGLIWVGVMASFLTYHTGSLVPAITMHILHNSSLLLLLHLLRT